MLAASASPQTISITVIGVMVGLFLIILGQSYFRTSRIGERLEERIEAGELIHEEHKSPKKPISRRDFFRGGASLAFLWPNLKGGFGSVIDAGSVDEIKSAIDVANQPFYSGAGRFYIVPYTGSGTDTIYKGIAEDGLMALYQKCVHLGCRVPFCQSSQWFECPCHGSKYNEAGEYQLGPAPTGLQRFTIAIESGRVKVDTATPTPGPPRGTNTTNQAPEGPFCV
jgi:cytochrome b6-f complex iron-sulfur subunit